MENITITVSGTFSKEAIEKFADFLGYQEIIDAPIPYQNPLTRVDMVKNHIKEMWTTFLSQMQLTDAKLILEKEMYNNLTLIADNIKNEIQNQITIDITQ